jgi:hypothetical protein
MYANLGILHMVVVLALGSPLITQALWLFPFHLIEMFETFTWIPPPGQQRFTSGSRLDNTAIIHGVFAYGVSYCELTALSISGSTCRATLLGVREYRISYHLARPRQNTSSHEQKRLASSSQSPGLRFSCYPHQTSHSTRDPDDLSPRERGSPFDPQTQD